MSFHDMEPIDSFRHLTISLAMNGSTENLVTEENATYRALQKHLNSMPVGYPKTKDGSDLKLLSLIFTPEEAWVAQHLDYIYRPLQEIFSRFAKGEITLEKLAGILDEMAIRNIYRNTRIGEKKYALLPFIAGIYELQISRLSPEMVNTSIDYFAAGFAVEYLSTKIPQMRVIPVEQAIEPTHAIATYDELGKLIAGADKIAVSECICKKAKDILHKPCTHTSRRETCLYFNEYADTFIQAKLGREISKEEAQAIAQQNEQDGLILQPSNQQVPQAICSCCSCCCGIITMLLALPKPVKLVASNFRANVNSASCKGCGACTKRCNFKAITVVDNRARVDLERCVGCGLCVPTCKQKAVTLLKKTQATVPPVTIIDMYDTIKAHKAGMWAKIKMILEQNPIKLMQNIKKAKASLKA